MKNVLCILALVLTSATGHFCLAHPATGIVVDSATNVFFVSGPRIVRVDLSGSAKVVFHDAQHTRFYQLHHLFLDKQTNLYTAADTGSGIWKLTPEAKLVRHYPPPNDDRSIVVGLGGDPFALQPAGHIITLNAKQDRFTQLLRIAPDGRVAVLAGGDWGLRDGRGEQARFGDLHGSAMVAASDGTLFLTDHGRAVRSVTTHGQVNTVAGAIQRGYRDGKGSEARFDGISGIAIQKGGDLFVADTENHRIRKITRNGATTTFAGSGTAGSTDGPSTEARFDQPKGLAFGPDGALYVLEPHHGRVRKILNGQVTTLLRSAAE